MKIQNLFRPDFDFTKLPKSEIPNLLLQIDIEIRNYIKHIQNYPKERFLKCGKPYLNKMRNIKKELKKMAL